jgi:uncharacterized protein YbaR (Trm112 family)
MKRSIIEILACPVCKEKLEMKAGEEKGGEITTGSLRCPRCGVTYPITEGIPDLLPPEKTLGNPSTSPPRGRD